ncbi:uncharacterized protein LOC125757653 isoform X1 [Rhipicephalus sanguineus]|uniref:uncharacterized protein LOC125757653 isoform X1 n=1 Tax=Rhipicephalus sanguineus TaxID=34632 RepID=UPI0020C57025|nr:uncharacterized protein LOC125757653 isoform X1 [Rhipicephalus sanguineus]
MILKCPSSTKTFVACYVAGAMSSNAIASNIWWCAPSTMPKFAFDATIVTTVPAPTTGLLISSVFIRRLSLQRKMQRHRQKRSNTALLEESRPELTKEVALAELQLLASNSLKGATINYERVLCLLRATYQDRCQHHVDPLPNYFLVEETLCAELQLRFGFTVDEAEQRLEKAAQVFSEKEGRETSFLELSKHLQGSSEHSLIIEAALPTEIKIAAPHVYVYKDQAWVYGGSKEEIIHLKELNIERAVVICFLIYYLKNLMYPSAFSQTLNMVQKLLRPQEPIPRGLISNRLKCFLALLKKKKV